MEKKLRILSIICKATSSLDTVLPLIDYTNRMNSNIHWTVAFWSPEKKKVLKGSHFYTNYLLENNIDHFDLISEIFGDGFLGKVVRKIAFKKRKKFLAKAVLYPLKKMILFMLSRLRPETVIGRLNPDVILLDHRSNRKEAWVNSLKEYLVTYDKKVVLMPHAPHHTGTEAFAPYSEQIPLPENFDYWMPFKYDKYWVKLPEMKDHFYYSGYPGLDSAWVKKCAPKKDEGNADEVRAVFIIRKIFGPHIKEQPKGHDNYAYFYDEFKEILLNLLSSLKKMNKKWTLAIKPHPATDRGLLKKMLMECGVVDVVLDDDSIYDMLPRYDVFISLYSTTVLVPAVLGVPTVVLDSRIQREIEKWEETKRLYRDLSGFSQDRESLEHILKQIEDGLDSSVQRDIVHLREYFPDNAAKRSFDRIMELSNR